ncbi:twin-arginine translocation pathway signal protein [Chryseobacterium lactis]|uniref:NAD(P)/FAD-dependent oxidoreductase n=2 Tax=Chryseobacterium lactis TaxID=1241981 RepID=A0A3G6RPR1_CHRLC|nr:FAD/NAD(P)-binding protein [Chryseobacterium lactis]AZA81885.1 NAD(P)/FAD-dependent oxidoreductase [Chryseobacterium lactis]AZB06882.1 NAD(P)/FAD-dependent oxidoreductase [Chryseobacterium lactis]PNW15735.1 twin-arginine translocation pathway signal protein [Chryseobacterium lactis]
MILLFLQYCGKKGKLLLLKISGTNHILGHRLWAKNFPQVSEVIHKKYLIVGGGISGLSACRFLNQHNENDYLVLEMENHLGGNSSNGQNQFSKFPLGAHYLPLPNKENTEIIDFLKECGIYQGDDENGEPVLDEYQMTFPQQERLFFKNSWQNDIVPQKGISQATQKELERFFTMMDDFRQKKDQQGNYWFAIPVHDSSKEDEVIRLEKVLFKDWLGQNNFKSEELLWLLDYSCRDDYGLGIDYVSAWAGIHYFAGRKNNWSKLYKDQVFTWPEGNARLATYLSKYTEGKQLKEHLVFDIKANEKVEVLCFDNAKNKTKKIIAEKVLLATPQFINERILSHRKTFSFQYVPWLLTTITLKNEFGGDEELAWDNVIYGSAGLGYIYDQHQNINQITGEKVITYYRSFSTSDCRKARKKLFSMKENELKVLVLDDLKKAHPLIEDFILEMQFHKIGHAMIAPIPDQIFGNRTKEAKEPVDGKIFFAHSDLSGISIFEEAFYQGIKTAKQML